MVPKVTPELVEPGLALAPGPAGVGRRDGQRQQISQGIDGRMHLRALLFLGPVKPGAHPAFRRRLQRAGIEDRRRGLLVSPFQNPDRGSQIVRDGLEHARLHPAAGLLISRRSRREIVRQESPMTTRFDHVPQCVERLPQRIIPLRRILAHPVLEVSTHD